MRKLTIVPLIAIAALLALPALASAATVTLGDNFFSPSSKTVGAGTKVKFNWSGNRRHNVTKVRGPGGGFSSTTTKRDGVNFAKTFARPGVYKMVCTLHPTEMKLTLTVTR